MSSTLNSNTEDSVDLPRDVFHDIFLRLPYKYTFKFRCVSKLWLKLLSDASLVNKVFKNTTSILNLSPVNHLQLYQTSFSQKFHNESRNGFCFHLLKDPSICRLRLLASCNNGLVLYSTRRWRRYYVFNPLTKQRVPLPRRPRQHTGNVGYTRLVSEFSITNLTCNFKVVFIPNFVIDIDPHYFIIQIFSSETGEWNIHTIHGQKGLFTRYSDMIIRKGVLYWTDEEGGSNIHILRAYGNNKHIIRAYDLNINHGKRIELPAYWPINKQADGFFGESEGSIYYGHIDRTRDMSAFLSVWMLQDDCTNGGWTWESVHKNIELEDSKSPEKVGSMFKIFDPADRNGVIFTRDGCCLAYNIGTGTFEVLRCSSVSCFATNVIKFSSSSSLLITPKLTMIPLSPQPSPQPPPPPPPPPTIIRFSPLPLPPQKPTMIILSPPPPPPPKPTMIPLTPPPPPPPLPPPPLPKPTMIRFSPLPPPLPKPAMIRFSPSPPTPPKPTMIPSSPPPPPSPKPI